MMPSPTVPLSVENDAICRASAPPCRPSRSRRRARLPGRVRRRRRQAVRRAFESAAVVAPGAGTVGGGVAEQRRAVIHLTSRWPGRAGQRQGVVAGDAVADRAAVGRERRDDQAVGAALSTVTLSAVEATPVLPADPSRVAGQAVRRV